MSTINIRTDKSLKKEASKVLGEMGLNMSSAVNLFLYQVVITRSIPFKIRTENGFSPSAEAELLKDAAELKSKIKSGKAKLYGSAEEAHADM